MTYDTAKFIHIVGVVVLVGNVTATAMWKFFADRDGDPKIVGFSQRLITLTDWSLTFWGVVLTIIGGYGAAMIGGFDLLSDRWLVLGQCLFLISGIMWVGILVPLQVRMARLARRFEAGGSIPKEYVTASRAWFLIGITATVPLIAATWVMVTKPS